MQRAIYYSRLPYFTPLYYSAVGAETRAEGSCGEGAGFAQGTRPPVARGRRRVEVRKKKGGGKVAFEALELLYVSSYYRIGVLMRIYVSSSAKC